MPSHTTHHPRPSAVASTVPNPPFFSTSRAAGMDFESGARSVIFSTRQNGSSPSSAMSFLAILLRMRTLAAPVTLDHTPTESATLEGPPHAARTGISHDPPREPAERVLPVRGVSVRMRLEKSFTTKAQRKPHKESQ